MRLGFAVAAHIDADVLLLDEVFAVGDEEFQRKCFAKIFEFKQRGGTIVFVSHDAASVERLCERAVLLRDGRVELDGSTQEAIARYHTLLAEERDPEESAAGLREYGSGEARIAQARLLGPGRRGAAAVRSRRAAHRRAAHRRPRGGSAAERSRSSSATRPGLLLAAAAQDTAELGWREEPGERVLRFAVDRSPLADGRFRLRFELGDPGGRHLYHWLDDAVRFVGLRRRAGAGVRSCSQGRWALRTRLGGR